MLSESYSVYILHCPETDKLYIGYTSNIQRRLAEHNSGRSQYTRSQGKWKLLFCKKMNNKSEAISLERKLKRWKNKNRILQWINKETSFQHSQVG
jgi:putative endonuclease